MKNAIQFVGKLDGKDVDPIFADAVDDRPIANSMQWIAYATWT
jgi:hypothetical protein